MEITKDAKTIVGNDLFDDLNEENGSIYISIMVDHLDEERPFCPEFNDCFNGEWITFNQMVELKKTIDKAVKEYKAGFKPIK